MQEKFSELNFYTLENNEFERKKLLLKHITYWIRKTKLKKVL